MPKIRRLVINHSKDTIVIVIPKISKTWRIVGCCAMVALSAGSASAQDRSQQQQIVPQKLPSPPPLADYHYTPPGYYPDYNYYWAPSGRPPEVLRPVPPG